MKYLLALLAFTAITFAAAPAPAQTYDNYQYAFTNCTNGSALRDAQAASDAHQSQNDPEYYTTAKDAADAWYDCYSTASTTSPNAWLSDFSSLQFVVLAVAWSHFDPKLVESGIALVTDIRDNTKYADIRSFANTDLRYLARENVFK